MKKMLSCMIFALLQVLLMMSADPSEQPGRQAPLFDPSNFSEQAREAREAQLREENERLDAQIAEGRKQQASKEIDAKLEELRKERAANEQEIATFQNYQGERLNPDQKQGASTVFQDYQDTLKRINDDVTLKNNPEAQQKQINLARQEYFQKDFTEQSRPASEQFVENRTEAIKSFEDNIASDKKNIDNLLKQGEHDNYYNLQDHQMIDVLMKNIDNYDTKVRDLEEVRNKTLDPIRIKLEQEYEIKKEPMSAWERIKKFFMDLIFGESEPEIDQQVIQEMADRLRKEPEEKKKALLNKMVDHMYDQFRKDYQAVKAKVEALQDKINLINAGSGSDQEKGNKSLDLNTQISKSWSDLHQKYNGEPSANQPGILKPFTDVAREVIEQTNKDSVSDSAIIQGLSPVESYKLQLMRFNF